VVAPVKQIKTASCRFFPAAILAVLIDFYGYGFYALY